MKNNMATRIILLLGWIFGILLPLASLRRFSTSCRVAFDRVFDAEASHVLMHTFLYAILAYLIASLVPRRVSAWRVVPLALIAVGIVAVVQETIQMACEQVPINIDTIFDWCVDINGGLLGAMIFLRLSRRLTAELVLAHHEEHEGHEKQNGRDALRASLPFCFSCSW